MDYSVRMDTSSTTALARAAPAALRPAGGMVALARALRSPRLRRAAVAGAAFGLGFQLSRALRAYRTAAGDEPPATAWRQGGWAWRSLTIVTVGYRAFQRDE
ncbi:MAG: hypothetical protein J4N29_02645 [Chloroflexi bacterium]|nr:hypothetical protein [Chloroflexota bacterium]